MSRTARSTAALALLLAGGAVACSAEEIVPEPYRPTDAHDAYRHGLELAGLAGTALGRDFSSASDAALRTPVQIELPYREEGHVDERQAQASGYRFAAERGQRIEATVAFADGEAPRVFLDLYRVGDTEAEPLHVASAAIDDNRLAFEPRRPAQYVLRFQPELLRGGRYTLEVRLVAALEFPVQDRDMTDIQSAFGAPRDAGRRSHHGVDIFAPRGTPALAATRAYVRRVGEQRLGGNVVWLYDRERSLSLYYAHLDSQAVRVGTMVEAGQPVGYVGNSGNARTTPPHLHFAIYARGEGPIDPDTYLRAPRGGFAEVRADTSMLGAWASPDGDPLPLRSSPSRRASALTELLPGTPVRVWAASSSYYRVTLASGLGGFVSAAQMVAPERALTLPSE